MATLRSGLCRLGHEREELPHLLRDAGWSPFAAEAGLLSARSRDLLLPQPGGRGHSVPESSIFRGSGNGRNSLSDLLDRVETVLLMERMMPMTSCVCWLPWRSCTSALTTSRRSSGFSLPSCTWATFTSRDMRWPKKNLNSFQGMEDSKWNLSGMYRVKLWKTAMIQNPRQ